MPVSRACPRTPWLPALVILDLDHTLIDWTAGWARATRAMLRVLAAHGLTFADAEPHLRASYRRAGTMDTAGALEDLRAAVASSSSARISRDGFDRAARAYRDGWSRAAQTLPGVVDGLVGLRRSGCRLIAYTESPARAAVGRLVRAGLDRAFDRVICTIADRDARHPALALECGPPPRMARTRVDVAPWWPKGSPAALREVLLDARVTPEQACAIGDHLEKDIAPAQRVGMDTIWARYGTRRAPRDQRLVDALCHWTPGEGHAAGNAPVAAAIVDRFDEIPFRLSSVPRSAAAW